MIITDYAICWITYYIPTSITFESRREYNNPIY
jgi:hypothetical protein